LHRYSSGIGLSKSPLRSCRNTRIAESMTKEFTYLNITFNYDLITEKRRTLVVEVKPDQSVIVKAPLHMKTDQIHEFLLHKIRWIIKHRHRFAKFNPATPKEYVNGENFRYLGGDYQLRVLEADGNEHLCIQENMLMLFSRRPHSSLYTRNLLDEWYAQEASRIFAEQLIHCTALFRISKLPKLAIRRMTSRLGSYSATTNRVCLNINLIKVTRTLIDYVVIHELCHITQHAHNRDFYNLLGSYLPQWEQLETELECALLSF